MVGVFHPQKKSKLQIITSILSWYKKFLLCFNCFGISPLVSKKILHSPLLFVLDIKVSFFNALTKLPLIMDSKKIHREWNYHVKKITILGLNQSHK